MNDQATKEQVPGADEIAWRPSEDVIAEARLTHFIKAMGVGDYDTLLRRSCDEPEWFHAGLFDFIDYRFYTPWERVLDESAGIAHAKWCLGGTTNVVLNVLDKYRDTPVWQKNAVQWEGEDGTRRDLTYAQLNTEVCRLAGGLRKLGIQPGDRVGMYLPNIPEAIVTLLAVAKIGGIVMPLFSGFGAEAISSRLADGEAVAVITVDGTPRRGKVVGSKSVVDEAAASLPDLKHVIVHRSHDAPQTWVEGRDHWWDELVADQPDDAPTEEVDADSPFLLVYTSGTTGKPKGVVHSHCGFPVKTALDLSICMDLQQTDHIMWMSDMGWLVGPILVFGGLLVGSTVVLIEGAPNYPSQDRIWDIVSRHRVSWMGVSPTLIRTLKVGPDSQFDGHDLSCLRVFASTGEPWTPDAWWWLFDRVGARRAPIMNYTGGTEMGGLVSSTVIHPQKPCSFNRPVPGTGSDIVNEAGEPVAPGEIGELVMRRPSIGLTRGLWKGDPRYEEGYWNVIPGLWVHGDFASRDEEGFWYLHGRSDDTLKIAGKRTGPSEVEAAMMGTGKVAEAAAIGTPDDVKGTAIVCVCTPAPGIEPSDALAAEMSAAVVKSLGAPFRPQSVHFVGDLPKTRNMKIMRRVIRAAWLGQDAGDLSTLVNPEAVEHLPRQGA